MTTKISNSFNRGRDGDLVNLSYNVINKLKGNPTFPNPPEALAAVEKLLPEYQQALLSSSGRDRKMASIKNTIRDQLRSYLKDLASYVTGIANGNKTILLDSGFILTGTGQLKPLSPVNDLQVALGASGEATTSVKRVAGAKAYMHQYSTSTPTDETIWVSEGSDDPVHTFTRLTSGMKYWFRVVAIGVKKQVAYSPVVSRFIQ
jgi:hypothetical protein